MEYRIKIIELLGTLQMQQRIDLLMSNTFQAGLDALDPNCPCYVRDRAIQECVYLGLRYQLLIA
jgi:hypothetical protein